MDKIWQTISGLFFAAVLTVTMAGKAKAEENEEPTLPDPAPTVIVEPAKETAQAGAPSGEPEESEPKATADTPATVQTAPGSVTETSVPASEAAAPAQATEETETKGGEETPAQVSETAAPVITETAPAEETAIPAEAGSIPAGEATVPSEQENAPAAEDPVSAGQENAPAAEGPVSAGQENVPAAEDPMTDGETGSLEKPAPAQEDALQEERTEPAEEESASDAENGSAQEQESFDNEQTVKAGGPAALAETEDPTAEEENLPSGGDTVSIEKTDPLEEGTQPAEIPAPSEENTPENEPTDPTPPVRVMRAALLGTSRGANASEPGEGDGAGENTPAGDETDGEDGGSENDPSEPASNEWVLVGDMEPQNITAETDITIKTAGLQRISSLVSDGDVYIVGTGILLLDDVDLLQGCGVYLQSYEKIYGENGGTAALFLFTGEENGTRTYELINGTYSDSDGEHVIPAILDEEYDLPAGINLVVPEGGDLVLQSINTRAESYTGQNGETVTEVSHSTTGFPDAKFSKDYPDYICKQISTAAVLNISSGSSVEIRSGGTIRLNHLRDWHSQFLCSPRINVSGTLSMEGDVIGGITAVSEDGDVTGDGTFRSVDRVILDSRSTPVTSINVAGGEIFIPEGTDIDSLNIRGSTDLLAYKDWTMNNLTVNNGTLLFYNYGLGEASTFTVTGTVSGSGTVYVFAGNLLLEQGKESCSAVIADNSHLGYAYNNEEGILRYDSESQTLKQAPLIPLVGTVAQDSGQISIPVADVVIVNQGQPASHGSTSYYLDLAAHCDSANNPVTFTCDAGKTLTYGEINSILQPPISENSYQEYYYYLIETCVDGAYGYEILNSTNGKTVTASSVVQIIQVEGRKLSPPDGSGVMTNTDTSYTGSGVLGGSGAGSVTGGARRLALSGSRASDEPDPDPNPDPEPDPAPSRRSGDVRVWTEKTQKEGLFELHIEIKGKEVDRTASPVKVRMGYTCPRGAEAKPLYAVFQSADGTLTAYKAQYDPILGVITFNADMAGEFIIVAFDYEGEPFTDVFYQALMELPEIRTLLM